MDDIHKLQVLLASPVPAYTDITDSCFDFFRDPASVNLVAGGFLYLGRRKPFGLVYVDVKQDYANSVATQLYMEYWDGKAEAWADFPLPVEDTKAFSRSGFIKWEPLISAGSEKNWGESEVSGASFFWVRFHVADDITAATQINGINIVFADDLDLRREDFGVMQLLPKDEHGAKAESHILSHLAAREEILRRLRNDGKVRIPNDGSVEDVDEWDLFRSGQIRQAAVFAALSRIYYQASDSVEDIWWQKYKEYEGKLDQAMKLFILSLDRNDDGLESAGEKNAAASDCRAYRR